LTGILKPEDFDWLAAGLKKPDEITADKISSTGGSGDGDIIRDFSGNDGYRNTDNDDYEKNY
jgi:hypothetical protein